LQTYRPMIPRRLRTPEDVEAAATSGDPGAIFVLLDALEHSDHRLRDAAFEALRDFGEPGFQAMVNRLLAGTMKQREAMAGYLGDWRDERALWPLLAAIEKAETERGVPVAVGCVGLYFWML